MSSSIKVHSAMIIRYKAGVDPQGADILKKVMYSNVKTAMTDVQLLAVGTSLGGLLAFPLVGLERQDTNEIMN